MVAQPEVILLTHGVRIFGFLGNFSRRIVTLRSSWSVLFCLLK